MERLLAGADAMRMRMFAAVADQSRPAACMKSADAEKLDWPLPLRPIPYPRAFVPRATPLVPAPPLIYAITYGSREMRPCDLVRMID